MFAGLIKGLFHSVGLEIHRYYPPPPPFKNPWKQIVHHLAACKVDVLLDVGANTGQFVNHLLQYDHQGRIISFEPLQQAHAELLKASQPYPDWEVFERCALGSQNTTTTINVAGNSQSSSVLPMTEEMRQRAPEAQYVKTESVDVYTLDSLQERLGLKDKRIGLKMDVQGYEAEVLAGAQALLSNVQLIQTEMSMSELYEGQRLFIDQFRYIESLGFECYALNPGFTSKDYRVMEVDGLFVRKQPAAK